jgi:hypothetical protein
VTRTMKYIESLVAFIGKAVFLFTPLLVTYLGLKTLLGGLINAVNDKSINPSLLLSNLLPTVALTLTLMVFLTTSTINFSRSGFGHMYKQHFRTSGVAYLIATLSTFSTLILVAGMIAVRTKNSWLSNDPFYKLLFDVHIGRSLTYVCVLSSFSTFSLGSLYLIKALSPMIRKRLFIIMKSYRN